MLCTSIKTNPIIYSIFFLAHNALYLYKDKPHHKQYILLGIKYYLPLYGRPYRKQHFLLGTQCFLPLRIRTKPIINSIFSLAHNTIYLKKDEPTMLCTSIRTNPTVNSIFSLANNDLYFY